MVQLKINYTWYSSGIGCTSDVWLQRTTRRRGCFYLPRFAIPAIDPTNRASSTTPREAESRLIRAIEGRQHASHTRAARDAGASMSLPPQYGAAWHAWADMHAHHTSRQPSPASLSGRAICVRPWPDSVLPRAFFPLVREGRLPSLLVHPASLPIPPLWVPQHRLSSGQLAVSSRLAVHRPDGRHCGPTTPSQRTSGLP